MPDSLAKGVGRDVGNQQSRQAVAVHSGTAAHVGDTGQRSGGDGGESNSPSKNLRRRPLRACPMICRRSPGRPSAVCRAIQSRFLADFDSGYATLPGIAPPLNDASTAHGGEAASTLTLLPKQRGREQTGCCQLLRLGSFLRGLETNLGSRSPVAGPCRNHASPQSRVPGAGPAPKWRAASARGLYSAPARGQLGMVVAPALGPPLGEKLLSRRRLASGWPSVGSGTIGTA